MLSGRCWASRSGASARSRTSPWHRKASAPRFSPADSPPSTRGARRTRCTDTRSRAWPRAPPASTHGTRSTWRACGRLSRTSKPRQCPSPPEASSRPAAFSRWVWGWARDPGWRTSTTFSKTPGTTGPRRRPCRSRFFRAWMGSRRSTRIPSMLLGMRLSTARGSPGRHGRPSESSKSSRNLTTWRVSHVRGRRSCSRESTSFPPTSRGSTES
mmetsp:Transcript_2501/g.5934  ORF Transcript_2501/g.5934 Transcript_2501/m.5934 type:complete len:213 (+) Transcript_2501:785-1423(+)